MTLDGYCSVEELARPMQHMADLHDRFRRRVVYRFGAWTAEMLEDFDVTILMKEVTLDGPDAELAFHDYMGQLMTHVPLGMDGLPPWDVWCIHYTSNPHRTDVLMRASHIIGDGQLFMKIIKQIMEPLDATAVADFAATVLGSDSSSMGDRSANVGRKDTGRSAAAAADEVEVEVSSTGGSSCGGSSSSISGGGYSSDGCPSSFGSDSGRSDSSNCEGLMSSSSSDAGDDQQVLDSQQQHSQQQRISVRGKPTADCMVRLQAVESQPKGLDDMIQQKQQQQYTEQKQQQPRRRRRSVWQRVMQLYSMLWRLIVMCWNGYTALTFTAILPFWFADPVTVVKAAPEQCRGPRKWSSTTINLSEFYRTAKLLGHSINTLAVTCLAGGVRRYTIRHRCRPATRVRLCSMVDTRSMPGLLTGTDGNSNNFSFIGVPLYTGDCSALERVTRVGGALSWIRHSLAVPLAIRMPSVLQFLLRNPAWSTWAVLYCLPWKATIGFSNMKGPAGSWSLSGYPVVRIHNGVQPMAFGCFVSLFTYADTLTFTHTCYSTKTENPQVLLACMMEEYEALRKAAALANADRTGSEPGSPGDKIKAA
eukprot:GHUV01008240.1.p1 GENE.GHUV01008240.1~~GHUV01008240.1.p1  ORF type:complete len:591 (+),score=176.96 GHUV01008240.1:225-1997(+)